MNLIQSLFIFLTLYSCIPGIGEDSGNSDQLYPVRSIKVICTVSGDCTSNNITTENMYIIYSRDRCSNMSNNYVAIAQSFSSLSCDANKCEARFDTFYETNSKLVEVSELESGQYTLISFIDLNFNESIDLNERL